MRYKLTLALAAALAATCVASAAAGVLQSEKREPGVSAETRAMVRQAISATGQILVRNSSDGSSRAPRPRGSGVVVRSDGVIATNYHVIAVEGTNRLYDEILFTLSRGDDVISSGSRYRVKPLLISKENDLALLGVESDAAGNPLPKSLTFPAVEIGDSRKIRLLEDLFIIGYPEKGGSTVTLSQGVIEGKDLLANWLKTDARVMHGNSGGAAVNSEGKLIGIPTRVLADQQPVDKDGDGFPDEYRRFGAVGFLRPSNLVADMLARLDRKHLDRELVLTAPAAVESSKLITVRGLVRLSGKPVAGALVGLLPVGETTVTESSLLTWGSTNADGEFKLNRQVPPGRYTLKAKPPASQPYTREVEINAQTPALIIELDASPAK